MQLTQRLCELRQACRDKKTVDDLRPQSCMFFNAIHGRTETSRMQRPHRNTASSKARHPSSHDSDKIYSCVWAHNVACHVNVSVASFWHASGEPSSHRTDCAMDSWDDVEIQADISRLCQASRRRVVKRPAGRRKPAASQTSTTLILEKTKRSHEGATPSKSLGKARTKKTDQDGLEDLPCD